MKNLYNGVIKYSLYLLVFLLPLFFLPFSYEAFEFNKLYLLVFLAGIAFLAWMAKMVFLDKELRIKRTILDIPILIFLTVMILSAVFSVDKISSLFGSYGRFSDGLIGLLSMGVLYFLITNNLEVGAKTDSKSQALNSKQIPNPKRRSSKLLKVDSLLKIFLCSSFFVILTAYFSIFGIWQGITTLGVAIPSAMLAENFNPAAGFSEGLSVFLAAAAVLLVGMLLNAKLKVKSEEFKSLNYWALLAASLGLLLLIDFISAWIILGLSLLLFVIFVLRKKMLGEKINILLLPIGLILISIFFSFFNLPTSQYTNLSKETFLSQRASFEISYEAAKENPILGSGIGTFFYDFSKFRPVDFNQTVFWQFRFDRAGSYILELLATGGILGILAYFLIFGFFFLSMALWKGGKINNFHLPIENKSRSFGRESLKKEKIIEIKVQEEEEEEEKENFKTINLKARSIKANNFLKNKSDKSLNGLADNFEDSRQLSVFCLFFVVAALFISHFIYYQNITIIFLFWLFLGMSAVFFRRDFKEIIIPLKIPSEKTLAFNIVPALLILIFLGCCYFGARNYIADAEYADIAREENELSLKKSGDILKDTGQARITNLEKAISLNPYRSQYRIALAGLYLGLVEEEIQKQAEEINQTILQNNVSRAIGEAKKATEMSPNSVAAWEIRGVVYRGIRGLVEGANKWAIDAFEKALLLEPTNPIIHTELGKLYLAEASSILEDDKKQKYETDAKKEFEKAIKLKSDYIDAEIQLALFYEYQGNIEEAKNQLLGLKSQFLNNAEIIFQLGRLYFNEGQIDKAIVEFEGAISLNPIFSNAHYSLGLCYQKKGEMEKAIAEFEKVLELNPENKDVLLKIEELKK